MSDRYRRDGGPPESAFSLVQRVRFGDLDAMQHMNNVEYLRFFETARIDYMMSILPQHHPGSRRQFGFIFAECHIAYRSPAHFGEEVRTWIWPTDVARSSIRLEFAMHSESDGRVLAEGYGVLVGYDYAAGEARQLPDELRDKLQLELVG